MIDLTFDPNTGIAKAATGAITLKAGCDVRVRVTMIPPPGSVDGQSLALIDPGVTGGVLAFTDTFTAENDHVFTALLDANDTRLSDFLTGKASVGVAIEYSATIDGVHQISPNVAATAQRTAVTGDEGTESGPGVRIVDGTDGHTYRLVSNGGILGLELVS